MRLTTQTLKGLFLGASCGALLVAAGAGCGGDDGTNMDQPMAAKCTADKVTGSSSKYATDSLKMPKATASMGYAYDIDGDGKSENQLKTLLAAVSQVVNIQDSVNEAVAKGDAIILADIKAPDLMTAGCAGITLALAKAPAMGAPPIKFDGSDTFQVGDIMGVKLYGKIENGKMSTTPSKDQTSADEQKIVLNLPIGSGAMLPLSIRGVHIEGTLGMNKGQPVITDGAIHGVISKKDIDNQIIPTVAQLVTKMVNDNPMGSSTTTVIGLFENMSNPVTMDKCKDMSKCCKTSPKTCVILPQEVKDSVVGGVLAPDVQVFDDNDQWKPVPNGAKDKKNGMSLGLGFSMIKASF
jgi:hypothetical protein